MNSRVLTSASRAILARSPAIVQVRNSSAYKPPAHWFPPTYNELPLPQGSWEVAYAAKQRKYNVHLALGLSFFLFTLGVIKFSDIVEFNARIPPLPELGEK